MEGRKEGVMVRKDVVVLGSFLEMIIIFAAFAPESEACFAANLAGVY